MHKLAYTIGKAISERIFYKVGEELPEINKGDVLLGGRFKNVSMEVEGFKTDENNQPVLETSKGDRKAFPFRIQKLMPEKK